MDNRRQFIKKIPALAAGFTGLKKFTETSVLSTQGYENQIDIYGDLIKDPQHLIDLPKNFTYKIISQKGNLMTDGLFVPGMPDGMAAFPVNMDKVLLIRNHELNLEHFNESPFGILNERFNKIDSNLVYDIGNKSPHLGGCTNILYDTKKRKVLSEFLSLAGTIRNCAGGPTPWGSWISCEEDVTVKGGKSMKNHGYNFEVPGYLKPQLAEPFPLKEMGRFNHEAIAIDPRTSIVYQTEDRDDGLIYRYIPNVKGKLNKGGKLQALAIRENKGHDMRNWPIETNTNSENLDFIPDRPTKRSAGIEIGQSLDVEWIDLENIESPNDDLRHRGHQIGAARFARGEGMWYDNNTIYFACTNGGYNKSGQIFKYTPSPHEGSSEEETKSGVITLFIEPNNTNIVEFADNITVAPWGDLIIAEDGPQKQYLRGITPHGKIYTLACNSWNLVEFAGPCFSTNQNSLFVNIQSPGLTLEITGPWKKKYSISS